MSVRKILTYPDPVLSQKAEPVVFEKCPHETPGLLSCIEDLRHTLAMEPNGLAIAANQIGELRRIFVISPYLQKRSGLPEAIVNPSYIALGFSTTEMPPRKTETEGCLSFPGLYAEITRWQDISVTFDDIDGKSHKVYLYDLAARCFQHETDHLDGKLFTEFMNAKERKRIEKLAEKRKRFTPNKPSGRY